MTLRFIPRESWFARAVKGRANPRPKDVYGIALHYTEGNVGNDAHTTCADKVRAIQRYHQDTKGWADIAYSFIVCQHGYVFVGRGTVMGPASQGTAIGNEHYWGVAWLGGPKDLPSSAAKAAILELRMYLMQRGTGSAVRPHSYFFPTACPGRLLSSWVRLLWPKQAP